MARNRTVVTQGRAEFRGEPFTRPDWQCKPWEYQVTEPYAVSTLARDLRADTDITAMFLDRYPGVRTYRDRRPDMVFLVRDEGGRFGTWIALTRAN